VFRAKVIERMAQLKLPVPKKINKWITDCKYVGKGNKAIVYLGRYLYRGVIAEKDIISSKDGKVTFRYINSKTKKHQYKKVTGEYFLYLIMQHVLPKGFRRARNYGFVHPNCKTMIALIHYLLKFKPFDFIAKLRPPIICKCCGAVMDIVKTQIKRSLVFDLVPT
jgi:hypothetical protein